MEEYLISYLYYPEGHMPCDEYAAILEQRGLAPIENYFSVDDITALNEDSASVRRVSNRYYSTTDEVWLDESDADLFDIWFRLRVYSLYSLSFIILLFATLTFYSPIISK